MSDKETIFVEEQAKEANPHAQANMTSGGNAAFHNFLNDFADIEDPLERRRLALEKIDQAPFGWYHVRAIIVAGVGFLTDSYDIFSINLGITMMSYVYWENGAIPSSTSTLLKVSTSVGTVIGQLGFGILADILGRKKIYGVELIVLISACVLQCTAGESPGINFPAIMTFYRIIMGIGIGGDYPLSSIITSEFATTKWRGAIMGAVFANQAWGQIAAGIVALVVVEGYKDSLEPALTPSMCGYDCRKACDQMWRILIGLGCVPGCIALYFRLTIPESPRYVLDCEANAAQAIADTSKFISGQYGDTSPEDVANLHQSEMANIDFKSAEPVQQSQELDALRQLENTYRSPSSDGETPVALETADEEMTPPKASFKDFCRHFGKWKHGKILFGCAFSWFALDVAFYGLGLNTAVILEAIGYSGKGSLYKSFHDTAVGNLILICAGSLPGYWASVFTIDIVGRKPIQIMGFIILLAMFCLIGFDYHNLSSKDLLGLYIICEFFQNFGPNVTTFILPGEAFPTRYRSSAHGICAASGKIGAIIAQTALGTLIDHNCARDGRPKNCWLPHVMEIFALFMLLGLISSVFVPETKRMTLEEISEKYHGEIDPSKYRQTSVSCRSDTTSAELEDV